MQHKSIGTCELSLTHLDIISKLEVGIVPIFKSRESSKNGIESIEILRVCRLRGCAVFKVEIVFACVSSIRQTKSIGFSSVSFFVLCRHMDIDAAQLCGSKSSLVSTIARS